MQLHAADCGCDNRLKLIGASGVTTKVVCRDIGRPLDHHRQVARAAQIGDGIARMIDGSDDKAGIGERLGRIVMADQGAASAVRDNNERQLVATGRTILHPGTAMLPSSISLGGSEQAHRRPAGTSIKRKPAACAGVAVKQRAILRWNLAVCTTGSHGWALLRPNG